MENKIRLQQYTNVTETLEMLGEAALIISPQHEIIFENSLCKKMYGEKFRQDCHALHAKQETKIHANPFKKVFAEGETAQEEFCSKDRDGNDQFIEIIASPLIDDLGKIVGAIEIVRDLTKRKKAEIERETLLKHLEKALAEAITLGGILPICAICKKIRNNEDHWEEVELYFEKHSLAYFSHGFCPDCVKKHYPHVVMGNQE